MPARMTQERFISRSNQIHNNKYDYSKTIYVRTNDKVIIICPIHDEFSQRPHDHLGGHECEKCGFITNNYSKIMTYIQFLDKANTVHQHKYKYYPQCFSAGIITIHCPVHGDFKQKRGVHLRGHGCQDCGNEK